ncbi:MAG: peptidoglycan-binding protein [Halocynthiibacter sp.]
MKKSVRNTGALLMLLAGCEAAVGTGATTGVTRQLAYTTEAAPQGAVAGSCWGLDVSPAVVETVTEQLLVRPAEIGADGAVLRPAAYLTEIRQEIVQPRQDLRFETPCASQMTAELIATLQRALRVRGIYPAPISGILDDRTRRAIRDYQAEAGLDSGILSLVAARKLGLIAVARVAPE